LFGPISSLLQENGRDRMAASDNARVSVVEATGSLYSDRADELFEAISRDDYAFFLDGGCDHSGLGRYSIFGSRPTVVVRSVAGALEVKGGKGQSGGDPLKILDEHLAAKSVAYYGPLPFVGGAVGYIGYEPPQPGSGGNPSQTVPDLEFGLYDEAVVCDNLEGRVWLASCGGGAESLVERFRKRPAGAGEIGGKSKPDFKSDFTRGGYYAAVERVKEYIREGDVYQVNLSQRFEAEAAIDPWTLYRRLRKANPAPFSAYLGFGGVSILSSSPERFLRVRGRAVETRPIKGTRPRGRTAEEDGRLAAELLASRKDGAEHVMIVDLERNDLGKVCEYGSVKVTEFERLESYAAVHHMVSTVEGTLREGVGPLGCVRACFPGGSITGAPKVRAMEIIRELEPSRRGVYTGSIGYIGYSGAMDLNIAIRTVVAAGGKVSFSVGGGIVADSTPEEEYAETLDKARALFQSFGIMV
jgi:para-aminobenzoate synthetase component I